MVWTGTQLVLFGGNEAKNECLSSAMAAAMLARRSKRSSGRGACKSQTCWLGALSSPSQGTTTITWSQPTFSPTQLPPMRAKAATCLHNGKLWVFGGEVGHKTYLNDMWCCDLATVAWRRIRYTKPTTRAFPSSQATTGRPSGPPRPRSTMASWVESESGHWMISGGDLAERDKQEELHLSPGSSMAYGFDFESSRWYGYEVSVQTPHHVTMRPPFMGPCSCCVVKSHVFQCLSRRSTRNATRARTT